MTDRDHDAGRGADPITLTDAEIDALDEVGTKWIRHNLSDGKWRTCTTVGLAEAVEHIKTTAYAQGRADALRKAVEAIRARTQQPTWANGTKDIWFDGMVTAARVVAALDGGAS